jgi:hypothetical protein
MNYRLGLLGDRRLRSVDAHASPKYLPASQLEVVFGHSQPSRTRRALALLLSLRLRHGLSSRRSELRRIVNISEKQLISERSRGELRLLILLGLEDAS